MAGATPKQLAASANGNVLLAASARRFPAARRRRSIATFS
jgi:hypothetical protein